MTLSFKQHAAVTALEAAFALCRAAGISFVGMDRTLYALDLRSFSRLGYRRDLHNALQLCESSCVVETEGAYLASGSWDDDPR